MNKEEMKSLKMQDIKTAQDAETKNMEMYLYSLRRMAEYNVEDNRTFMTNLYNLRAFQYKGAEVMRSNPDLRFALILMDLANFKTVNEFCGRTAGDDLLKCIADAFRAYESELVTVSHFRADIFAMLTPFDKEEELVEVVKTISRKIADFKIACKVLPAFGICIATDPTMSINYMRDYASLALKTIKGKFYSNYAFFDDNMRRQMLLEKQIENDIVEALETGQFRVYIQPKVDMETGEIIGGEALVRWCHPEKGIIGPNEFIPVLEKNGFIINVDMYVWTEVFKYIGKRLEQGKSIVPISINISRLHVYDNSFKDYLIRLKDEYHVPPRYVPLELTESGFLKTESLMYTNMQELKEHGFLFSMDDFGTGYSTMAMLQTQPVDEIKIDKAFIGDMSNPKSRIVVSNTIHMLKELNLDIIAEGVEDQEQQDFLVGCGCKRAQGFYYYKPMPMEDFFMLLK